MMFPVVAAVPGFVIPAITRVNVCAGITADPTAKLVIHSVWGEGNAQVPPGCTDVPDIVTQEEEVDSLMA